MADWLRISLRTVRRLEAVGRLKCHRVGLRGDRRFKRKDVEEYLNGRVTGRPARHKRDRLLSMQEASLLLGVHPNTLRRWVDIGEIKAERIGSLGERQFYEQQLEPLHEELLAISEHRTHAGRQVGQLTNAQVILKSLSDKVGVITDPAEKRPVVEALVQGIEIVTKGERRYKTATIHVTYRFESPPVDSSLLPFATMRREGVRRRPFPRKRHVHKR